MDLRIGDAERDAVTAALHEHFAAGRLTRDELDERLEAALTARTEGDLREIVRDLPGPSGLPRPAPAPAWHPHHGHPAFRHGRRPRHRHGPPPVVPILFLLFLVGTFTAGPATGAVLALKAAAVLWLFGALFAFLHLRRHWRRVRH
ncbi:DUF1707 SHOCT-like domain-containing protein [Thermomonospora cellulosilytica]|uniref:DUF1707 domain-containing protein n=1 Tax=Thermomonospora cellulosilytica TaxID=1411118 RepID=A0A7W3MZ82_9ACTN|nr:DUF1707 domain-containing protein [Thermomonospora cellulosilytica]MBA9004596.1 hypothetical protein [Thermomonospora cellulosilytica]